LYDVNDSERRDGISKNGRRLFRSDMRKGGAIMKGIVIALLVGMAIPIFGFWRLEIERGGSSGCLLPFILSVLVMSVGALPLA
jgi:hypothetical protein